MKDLVVTIAGFKPAPQLSEETLAFVGNLVLDGVEIAGLSNRGQGDPVMSRPVSKAAQLRLEELSAFLKDQAPGANGLRPNLDWFLTTLAGLLEDRRVNKRKFAKKTLVRFKSQTYEPDGWSAFNGKCTPEVLERLTARFGEIVSDLHSEIAKPIAVGAVLDEMRRPVDFEAA